MSAQFHVLASGSSGNASVIDAGGFGVLLDFGLSARELTARMKKVGLSWERIHAVLLTHEHTDHWQAAALSQIAKLRLPIYCHEDHAKALDQDRRAWAILSAAGLIHHYQPGRPFRLGSACEVTPIALEHDVTTAGFRFDASGWSLGYAADLGCWRPRLAQALADVDVLAIEFNHDVAMQLDSGRNPRLIRRVLGDEGHLSNEQGANLLAAVLRESKPGRVKHLVQLHLSRECNRPDLAQSAAQKVIRKLEVEVAIHTATQDHVGPTLTLAGAPVGQCEPVEQTLLPFA